MAVEVITFSPPEASRFSATRKRFWWEAEVVYERTVFLFIRKNRHYKAISSFGYVWFDRETGFSLPYKVAQTLAAKAMVSRIINRSL